jgi:hypothetical protein
MTQRYDDYETTSTESYDNIELKFTPYTTVEGEIDRVFGVSSQYGQSLGVNMDEVELVDGALYVDPEKEVYKLFSWKNIAGLSISESLERGNEPAASDAPEVETKNYAGNEKTYELVAARVPEVTEDGGDVALEASSRERDVSIEDGTPDFSEWEDQEGDRIGVGSTITWHGGSDEYGPTASSKSIATTLTTFGGDAVEDEEDIHNWLPDDSGDDLLRSDLEDRRVQFFMVTRESENGYTYHAPIFEDVSTGEEISPNNRASDSDEVQEARQADEGEYPEPLADFVNDGQNLNLNEERAENLLDELLEDSANGLTEEMLEDAGGRDEVLEMVV